MNLQKSLEELESITKEFEQGELDLEESLVKFKKGLKLAKDLKGRLAEIENEIKEITVSIDTEELEVATDEPTLQAQPDKPEIKEIRQEIPF